MRLARHLLRQLAYRWALGTEVAVLAPRPRPMSHDPIRWFMRVLRIRWTRSRYRYLDFERSERISVRVGVGVAIISS